MAYLEKEKNEIKDTWFYEHVVSIQGEEGLQKIIFSKPGDSEYRVNYVLSGNTIFISGDIGEAVYSLTCAATFENIKRFNLSYFTGKLTAFSESRWSFNSTLAKNQLSAYWEDSQMTNYQDAKDIYRSILNAIEESGNFENYQGWILSVYNDTTVEYEHLEPVFDFGKETPMTLIAYWVGLQLAIEQLEITKEK